MTKPLIQTPLAVIGMACCLPGARHLSEYWDLLREGRDPVTELPPERLDRQLYFHPEKGVRGKTYATLGGLVPERPRHFLPQVLTDEDCDRADPCHLLLADVAVEACSHAGYDVQHFPLPNTGVYIGHSGGSPLGGDLAFRSLAPETIDFLTDDASFLQRAGDRAEEIIRQVVSRLQQSRPARRPGGGPDVEAHYAAALIARALRLHGPHFVMDAACASSLVALATAALALQEGQIDAAVVGGASFNKGDSLVLFSQAQSCSARGSRPFDRDADGLISSEGYVALLVKLLPRALADGDPIQAVIRGLGISSDGRGKSLWAPRREGQREAVRRAYGPDLDPGRVGFIEAHATSTQLGDATELQALADFFGPFRGNQKLPIGSVKSNIGHTLETAGLAGLLKAILTVQHGEIPATIHLQHPNEAVDWDQLPFYVPTRCEPWPRPAPDQPRCAAVNAFGIGGLNVHAVIEEYLAPATSGSAVGRPTSSTTTPQGSQPIAIIGRAVILPGATDLQALAALLRDGTIALSEAPESRWRKRIGVHPGRAEPGSSPHSYGGYVTGWSYDWKAHKIPPKQIAQANPLQFMLLDATRAALADAGYSDRDFDRSGTAVVVGSVFGGEFGNQLHVGLRLPEIRRELDAALRGHGFSASQTADVLDAFERRLLAARPALLDETGSFTSSTLASRISKTWNLMGGALAIDAGDCSSFAALSVSCSLLRSGTHSLVICAAAQRAMDLPAFESLHLSGRLPTAADHHDGYFPGEGVVVLVLKRLDQARNDGDRVWGIIHSIGAGSDPADLKRAVQLASERARPSPGEVGSPRTHFYGCDVPRLDDAEREGLKATYGELSSGSSRLVRQIGHTQAAHGLALLVSATLETSPHPATLSTHTSCGQAFHVQLSPTATTADMAPSAPAAAAATLPAPAIPFQIFRLGGTSLSDLLLQCDAAEGNRESTWTRPDQPAQLAIVYSSPEDFAQKRRLAVNTGGDRSAHTALRERGIFFAHRNGSRPAIAWMFPGQGSQYPAMLRSLVEWSPAAARAMADADRMLREQGEAPFSELVWGDPAALGGDLWVTQIAVLLADTVYLAAAGELGATPDYVAGHSFGEFAALLAAGSLTLPDAIRLTRARATAVAAAAATPSGMLSIQANPAELASWLQPWSGRLFLSHQNAPEQLVVGGTLDALEQFETELRSRRIPARRLPVPLAFHTELLRPATPSWRAALQTVTIRPPRIPFLSSVTNRFEADPEIIRENLAAQLTTPIDYVRLVQRLGELGVGVLLEVGPQQILTRLHRRILTDAAVCIGLDNPHRSAAEQFTHVAAELDCLGCASRAPSTPAPDARPAGSAVAFFDATLRRKQQRQAVTPHASRQARPVVRPVIDFDATSLRVERHRSRPESAEIQHDRRLAVQPEAESSSITRGLTDSGQSSPAASLRPIPHVGEAAERMSPSPARQDAIDALLIDFIMDQTGYPKDLIQFDWDLEADLGIDSIKRAQLFGELREMFGADTSDREQLQSLRTLNQIADWLRRSNPSEIVTPARDPDHPPPASSLAGRSDGATGDLPLVEDAGIASESPDTYEAFLIQFVVEQTGYPAEIVELDADFEADLGIDSIKKSQLFGELREQFSLPLTGMERSDLGAFRTLRDVLHVLREHARPEDLAQVAAPTALALAPETAIPVAAGIEHAMISCAAGGDLMAGRDQDFQRGLECGESHALLIRRSLREAADHWSPRSLSRPIHGGSECQNGCFPPPVLQALRGLAAGAGVHLDNLLAYQHRPESGGELDQLLRRVRGTDACRCHGGSDSGNSSLTHRYVLGLQPCPTRGTTTAPPRWHGDAVILGDNGLARALRCRLAAEGRDALLLSVTADRDTTVDQLRRYLREHRAPHLFIVSPRDPEAVTTWDAVSFERRRVGISNLFWLCQSWSGHAIQAGWMPVASVVGVTALGGDFGFQGRIDSVESGAVTGLLKAFCIENWVSGHRSLPVKILDAAASTPDEALVNAIWHELATPSHDVEISIRSGERYVVRAMRQDADRLPRRAMRPSGNWVCTGGARGITAYAAQQLAVTFGVKLHLLGKSPLPQLPDEWGNPADGDLLQRKREVMQDARRRGENAIQAWERVEKAMEIDRTLRGFHAAGIDATYYPCDVADRDALAATLARIRERSGEIHGVLHGAGIGKDARFENKDPVRVEECLRAKIDGARLLMELTRHDPLQAFIAFGSISGRFGANGHTDYSLANDMLCKLVDWYRHERPDVRALAFHWHAWGDVGMATKPETRLALEMVGMQFMPAAEGVGHLLTELQTESRDSEILITDEQYYRKFYPADSLPESERDPSAAGFPLLDTTASGVADLLSHSVPLDPVREPFLVEHRLEGRPVLPIVVGMELLAEAAVRHGGATTVAELFNVEAVSGLRFHTDRPISVRLRMTRRDEPIWHGELLTDFRSRDGQLVAADRCYLQADLRIGGRPATTAIIPGPPADDWKPVHYAGPGSPVYLGAPFQCLRQVQFSEREGWGQISAPALNELAGAHRAVTGWQLPSAALDACLYASGLLCWSQVAPGPTLPVRIGKLQLGRLPRPGEACLVHVQFLRREGRFAIFAFTLLGEDRSLIAQADDYHVAWIGG